MDCENSIAVSFAGMTVINTVDEVFKGGDPRSTATTVRLYWPMLRVVVLETDISPLSESIKNPSAIGSRMKYISPLLLESRSLAETFRIEDPYGSEFSIV